VISGFNIAIIAALFTFLFTRVFGTLRGAIVSAIGIFLYTLMVGANPAVVRSAILGMLTLVGILIGRRQVGLNSLVFVAVLLAIHTPTVLWMSASSFPLQQPSGSCFMPRYFQMGTNFTARFLPRQKAEHLAGPIGEYFLITFAAMLTILPLIVYYFTRISLTAFIANPLILAAQPPLMVLGGLSVLTGMIFQPLGQLLAWVARPFTAYTIRVVEWM